MTAEEPTVDTRGTGALPPAAYREIVESSAASFLVLASDGTITYAAGSVRDILGWEPSDLRGRNMAEFLPQDQIDLAVAALAEVAERGRRHMGVPIVFNIRRREGFLVPVEIGAVPFLDVPEIDGTVIRLRDWSAQHHLDEFFAALVAEQPLDQMLSSLASAIAASLSAAAVGILHGFDGDAFAGVSAAGIEPDVLTLDRGPWCVAARTGVTVDTSAHDLLPAPPASLGLGACWAHPVHDGTTASAAIVAFHRELGPPFIGHSRVFERVARYVQLALTRSRERDRLERLAGTDPLTGALNRGAFHDRLSNLVDTGEAGITVAYCDLDGFKPVNDSFGHRAGDGVLVEVVNRLRTAVRREDVLARFGGDEFTILFRGGGGDDTARVAGQRLLDAMVDPYAVAGQAVPIGISIGIATSRPDDTADLLLARADAALYDAKRAGGGCVRVRS